MEFRGVEDDFHFYLSLSLFLFRSLRLSSQSATQIVDNPYKVITKVIPVSAQDSEIQSMSSDALTEDTNNPHAYLDEIPKAASKT